MEDGNVDRANTGRHKQLEHNPRGAQAPVAHRDFKGVGSSGREARRRVGRGEAKSPSLVLVINDTKLLMPCV